VVVNDIRAETAEPIARRRGEHLECGRAGARGRLAGDPRRRHLPGLRRHAQPDEIAAAAALLASDEASFITGQWVSPNGGLLTVRAAA
jgi:NAD(P)-dependent dehydrogenase (short-subunit alcohol dehydrogenase family)